VIDRAQLLRDCQRMLSVLVDDLRTRCEEDPALEAPLRAQWQEARAAARTAQPYESWRESALEQVAAAWVLACVFVRFLEDNGLVDPPRLAGPGERRKLALDQHTLYFRAHPTDSDRDYLLHVFRTVAELPAAREVFDERHNPLWTLGPSGDGATALLELFQRIDPDTGALVHDFTDPAWDTRFLGDLYQDLSENARKRYALLQTPDFVERFLLDRTLEPACAEFGFREVRLLDPTCGSGHFLLGAFARLFERWLQQEPGTPARELAQRALDQVAGVDLNPFAVAIARFRLLVAALRACSVARLADAPAFHLHVAAGDSLLHGARPGVEGARQEFLLREDDPLGHLYHAEDEAALRRILGRRYHAVVGNPPYITPKDAAQNQAYRERYRSCHRKYALSVPFTERFFDLAIAPGTGAIESAGFVGMITANSFMKREFGKKIVEELIPRWDLTHVVDTSGAYIPGHGTPTVILFGRHRRPVEPTIRAVMGIRGEPSTPDDPAHGLVWSAIVKQVDLPGSQSDFVSVADVSRDRFEQHPWSIGGGGAAELKELLDEQESKLADGVELIGVFGMTNADDAMLAPYHAFVRRQVEEDAVRRLVVGDEIRDWALASGDHVLFPYRDEALVQLGELPGLRRWLWPVRTVMGNRATFAKLTYFKEGRPWWEWHQVTLERLRTPLSIAFAEVATHNHFVLDRGEKVFNQTAPVIKLPPGVSEDDHLGLLGLLNSSTACFWLRQVCFPKGGDHVGTEGARVRKTFWDERFAFNATNVLALPLSTERPLGLAQDLDTLARERALALPDALVAVAVPSAEGLRAAWERAIGTREQMIALQEELDWRSYRLYGLLGEDFCASSEVPRVRLGERAFEIVLARKLAAGEIETQWFARHGSTPISEVPAHWPEEYRALVERRIAAIESNPNIALIEQPEYKRRWNDEPWEEQEARALRGWLLDRLETRSLWAEPRLCSVARLADRLRGDADFQQVAALYRRRPDFDLAKLVEELVLEEGVPLLPVLRYKPSGLRKRAQWEETWRLQRLEDEIDARTKLPAADPRHLSSAEATATKAREVGEIPVPPRYTSADFARPSYWRLRGKLDVPKERFVLYPGAERTADPTPVLGWAGWNHLEQAQALAAHYVEMQEQEGWPAERLAPLLAGLQELAPWLQQWHNDLDPTHQVRMGDYYAGFVESEARTLGLTLDQLRAWAPASGATKPRSRKKKGSA
jgi:hypothetical protein